MTKHGPRALRYSSRNKTTWLRDHQHGSVLPGLTAPAEGHRAHVMARGADRVAPLHQFMGELAGLLDATATDACQGHRHHLGLPEGRVQAGRPSFTSPTIMSGITDEVCRATSSGIRYALSRPAPRRTSS